MRWVFALALGVSALGGAPAVAQSYFGPGWGTATRATLINAIRLDVEWDLGEPIEFVADELWVAGEVASGSVSPQRPGGGAIDLCDTPGYRRGVGRAYVDGTRVAVHHPIGATDVWFEAPDYCIECAAVIRECGKS